MLLDGSSTLLQGGCLHLLGHTSCVCGGHTLALQSQTGKLTKAIDSKVEMDDAGLCTLWLMQVHFQSRVPTICFLREEKFQQLNRVS